MQFWSSNFILLLLALIIIIILAILSSSENVSSFIAGILFIPAFIISYALHVRRMHDINKNWQYAIILPIIPFGVFYFLYLLLKKGDAGTNTYGEPPKERKILSVIFNK